MIEGPLTWVVAAVVGVLVVATVASRAMVGRAADDGARATARNVRDRVAAWWVMVAAATAAFAVGPAAVIALFAVTSALALRELWGLVPFRPSDRPARLVVALVLVPLHYLALWLGEVELAVATPVVASLVGSARAAVTGDTERFLQRAAGLQYAVIVAVACLSCAPALLVVAGPVSGARWLAFLLAVTQFGDVFQYLWGRWLGHTPIAPRVSPNKTVEGLVGGAVSAGFLGAALSALTPLPAWGDGLLGVGLTLAGFLGGLVMSAIKRDAGVKDFSSLLSGHGGVMDRVDSLAFAAPVALLVARFVLG